jgi:hypothetical protein
VGGDVGSIAITGDVVGSTLRSAAKIGAVTVLGNWVGSNLAAGVIAGADALFGTDDDALISPANPLVARIASIVIKGSVAGTAAAGDHFGFVAEEIGAFRAAGAKLALTRGPENDVAGALVGSTGDLRVREVR